MLFRIKYIKILSKKKQIILHINYITVFQLIINI
jgi:hypothetical protein